MHVVAWARECGASGRGAGAEILQPPRWDYGSVESGQDQSQKLPYAILHADGAWRAHAVYDPHSERFSAFELRDDFTTELGAATPGIVYETLG
jgi:hypothetical protein